MNETENIVVKPVDTQTLEMDISYTCRAELNCDIPRVKKAMDMRGITYRNIDVRKGLFNGIILPGGAWTFLSKSSLEELLDVMNSVTDAHVMVQTLEKTEDYTGERKFERGMFEEEEGCR